MKKRNLRVPEVATVERNNHDVAAAVVKLLLKRPAAMIQIGTYAASSALVKEMRKASFAACFATYLLSVARHWQMRWIKMESLS